MTERTAGDTGTAGEVRGATILPHPRAIEHSGRIGDRSPADTYSSRQPGRARDIAIIIPTLNERANIEPLIRALDLALGGRDAEYVFVDDWSTDGTAELIGSIARERDDVRLIRRYGRRGLSSAAVEGILSTTATMFAVIDADLQHDEAILPAMLDAVASDEADVAIGSRYADGGSSGAWTQGRVRASRMATRLAQFAMPTPVADPMSGFFAMRRDTAVRLVPELSASGFKLLLDFLMSSPDPLRTREFPYTFRTRVAGKSKLDSGVALEYLTLLIDKSLRRFLPSRLILFGLVGLCGLVVHLGILRSLLTVAKLPFATAQTVAVMAAIAFNFFLNNAITYRDRRLRGARLVTGLASFYLICGAGAIANIGVGSFVFASQHRWLIAGLAGAVVGSLWNFVASGWVTWRKR